jgi:hypothetical protein
MKSWPSDADGDVFRSLQRQGFDFSKEYKIDFDIDFSGNCIPPEAFCVLIDAYPGTEIVGQTNECPPYIKMQVHAKVDYSFVVKMQDRLSEIMRPFGGWCESWGVLH